MNSNDFDEDITLKPYPKYKYQEVLRGPKKEGKEAFLKAISDQSNHLYGENPAGKRGYCFFCPKKSNKKPSNQGGSSEFSPYLTLQLNKGENSEMIEKKGPKRERF